MTERRIDYPPTSETLRLRVLAAANGSGGDAPFVRLLRLERAIRENDDRRRKGSRDRRP